MTNSKTTKRALLTSILALIVCFVMLLGTTYAWFTDSVTSGNNVIKSGTLDVSMEWMDGKLDPKDVESAEWKDVSNVAIFDYDKWEPGYTVVRHIKIENEGTLALKYQLNIVANGEVSELADVIDVYYVDPAVQVTDRTALANIEPLGTLTEVLAEVKTTGYGELEKDGMDTVTIALKMRESAGNYYQDLGIGSGFTVQLLATQLTSETDSFDDQYDKDADYLVEVATADDLAKAALAGGKIAVKNDIDMGDQSIVIPEGVTAIFELGDNTISADIPKSDGDVIINNGTLTINGGTVSSNAANGGSAIRNNGTATVNGTTLNGAPNEGGGWPSYAVNNAGVMTLNNTTVTSKHGAVASYGADAVVTLNDSAIDMAGIPGFTNHGMYTYSNGKIVINSGTYVNNAADQNSTGGSVINGNIEINNGTFSGRIENYNATPVIKGGVFTADPTRFVAEGYEVVAHTNGYIVVKEGAVAADKGDLTTAINNAEAGDTVVLAKNSTIDFGSTQYAIDKDITIDLNGSTLTTANAYGGMTLKGGASIKNGTINHTKTVAAIKVLGSVGTIENVEINVTPIDGKVITGIQLVNSSAKTIDVLKDVSINGATQGIEVKDCSPNGTATPAIGLLENVKVDATDVGMIVNGYIGKMKNCEIKGANIGINMLLKGEYLVSLDIENSIITGSNAGIYAHDEVGISNTNNCSLALTYDADTVINGGLVWEFEDECKSVIKLNAPAK